ncbi:hypothetical protein BJ741DRAFT_47396 [Chytriomyces cf. hyalinus JEL632]|nr:hypothetical protein BJ741DRAFT_47396 [Chytriomyces cf. hyalinus JEL632]
MSQVICHREHVIGSMSLGLHRLSLYLNSLIRNECTENINMQIHRVEKGLRGNTGSHPTATVTSTASFHIHPSIHPSIHHACKSAIYPSTSAASVSNRASTTCISSTADSRVTGVLFACVHRDCSMSSRRCITDSNTALELLLDEDGIFFCLSPTKWDPNCQNCQHLPIMALLLCIIIYQYYFDFISLITCGVGVFKKKN